jgi:hypothetical protein
MWSKFEPVRSWLYTVLVPVLGLLVAKGVVTGDEQTLWLSIGGAVLGVVGVEVARAKVTPTAALPVKSLE